MYGRLILTSQIVCAIIGVMYKYESTIYDCDNGGQSFQLLFQRETDKNFGTTSSVICTPELNRNDIVGFIDEMSSGIHMSVNLLQDDNYYGFFDNFWGVMKTFTDGNSHFLNDVVVNNTKRRQGLGSTLLKSGLAIHNKHGGVKVVTGLIVPECSFGSPRLKDLQNFYAKNGFNFDGVKLGCMYPNDKVRFTGTINRNDEKSKLLSDYGKIL